MGDTNIKMADEKNPAHFCMGCNKFIGYRGWCSEKCYDEYYDGLNKSMDENDG